MIVNTDNVFTTTGDLEHDFWLVNGSHNFGVVPAGVVDGVDELPIRLHVGTASYGCVHIEKHRHKWPKYVQEQRIKIVDVLYQKLGQPGIIYNAESASKCKINLRLAPNSLLILERRFLHLDVYWSVTTFYPLHSRIDGVNIGRYPGVPGRNPVRR